MTKTLMTIEANQPATMGQAMELAKMLASSSMVPQGFRGQPGDILVAIQMGAELGLPPMQAIQNIAVINGRPALWGDAVLALVTARKDCEDVIEEFDSATKTAYCTIKRAGRSPVHQSFSMDDAKRAGLAGKKGPWTQYPKRMLQLRARAFAVRDSFPDALRGIQVAEEMQDIPTEPQRAPSALGAAVSKLLPQKSVTIEDVIARFEIAETEEQLRDAGELASALDDASRADARTAYKQRLAELRAEPSEVIDAEPDYSDVGPEPMSDEDVAAVDNNKPGEAGF